MGNRPKKSFKSTEQGTLPPGVALVPGGRYSIAPKPGIPVFPFTDKAKLAAWIRDAVLGDLRTLRRGIEAYLVDPAAASAAGFAGGNYLLASGCFLAIEYFAQVFKGDDNATENVKAFMVQYLRPHSERYVQVGDLVWKAFRNGLIHGGWPKVLSVQGSTDRAIELMVGVLPSDPHLEPLPGRANTFCLNAVTLLLHLESAVAEFEKWILTTDEEVLLRGAPRQLELSPNDEQGVVQLELIKQWNDTT